MSGKTTLVSAPHDRLGKILSLASEPPAFDLKGVEREWVEGRVAIERLGWDEKTGKRRTGKDYYNAILDRAADPIDADTIVLDTHTAIAKNRHIDALRSLGGMPTEYRRENEAAQVCAINFLDVLEQSNPDKNIIALYHMKKIMKPGGEQILDTYWAETIGRKHDDSLAAKFHGCLGLERKMVAGKAPEFLLHLKRETRWKFVTMRSGFAEVKSPVDVSCVKGDPAPAVGAWDLIFDLIG